jgi:cytochrome d ubiquinol oxidase subunit I
VAVPVTFASLLGGSRFGIVTEADQPTKIAAAEALWNTEQPASFSLFQIGGFSAAHPDPSVSIAIPKLLSFLATGSFTAPVSGLSQLQAQDAARYGPGSYTPPVEAVYWSMRVMAYLGGLMFMIAALGAYLYRRGRLESSRWFLRTAVVAIAFPFIAATAGWVLTEVGRQPWIVQSLLKTAVSNSPDVSTAMIAISIVGFALLYIVLGAVDFVLMRRYARVDLPEIQQGAGAEPAALTLSY